METWAKRAFGWAVLAALLHCVAWAGYVYYLQRASYDELEQRRGVIEKITFSQTGIGGQYTRARSLVLVVRPLDGPRRAPQEISTGAARELAAEYFQRHRAGDVVPIWVKRQSGRIDDVLPPSPPDFLSIFLILLLPLGFVTAFAVVAVFGHRSRRHTSSEN